MNNCAGCHGEHLEGHPPVFPSLVGVRSRLSDPEIIGILRAGRKAMPAFPVSRISDTDVAALVEYLGKPMPGPSEGTPAQATGRSTAETLPGEAIFQQKCAFCHGKDAGGGDTGPDLVRSALVTEMKNTDTLIAVVRDGRMQKGMPSFNLGEDQLHDLLQFLRHEATLAASGRRRGVVASDLMTGDAERGKRYFYGDGGCSRCHSAQVDLAGIASRLQPLQLEEQMLYPRNASKTAVVTLANGNTAHGQLLYQDEFVLILRDSEHGDLRSWRKKDVRYTVEAKAEEHIALLARYSDENIHDLLAFLITLKATPVSELNATTPNK